MFLLFGVALTAVSLVVQQRDLLWVGVAFTLAPLVAALLVHSLGTHLRCRRYLAREKVQVGDRLSATIELTKPTFWPGGLIDFEDGVPGALGRRPRFTTHRFIGSWRRRISYPMLARERGRHNVGPLLIRSRDPFGLARSDRQFAASTEVMVTPRIVPLPNWRQELAIGSTGDATPLQLGAVGQDDTLVREYRSGDDLRRVHWRTSARRGKLFVRREQQSWDPSVSLILDNRASRHTGKGRKGSFETAVSTLASVALHLANQRFYIDIRDVDGELPPAPISDTDSLRAQILGYATDVQMSQTDSLTGATQAVVKSGSGDLVIAVLGRLDSTDAGLLLRSRGRRQLGVALVMDTDTFTIRSLRATPEQKRDHQDAIKILRENKWRVVEIDNEANLANSWQLLEMQPGAR